MSSSGTLTVKKKKARLQSRKRKLRWTGGAIVDNRNELQFRDTWHDFGSIETRGAFEKNKPCRNLWEYMIAMVQFGVLYEIWNAKQRMQPLPLTITFEHHNLINDKSHASRDSWISAACKMVLEVPAGEVKKQVTDSTVESQTVEDYTEVIEEFKVNTVIKSETAAFTTAALKNAVNEYVKICKKIFDGKLPDTIYFTYDATIGPLAALFKKIIFSVFANKPFNKTNIRKSCGKIPILVMLKTPQNITDSANDISYPIVEHVFPTDRGRDILTTDGNIFTKDKYKISYHKGVKYNDTNNPQEFIHRITPIPPPQAAQAAQAAQAPSYDIVYGIKNDKNNISYMNTSGPSAGDLALHYLYKKLGKPYYTKDDDNNIQIEEIYQNFAWYVAATYEIANASLILMSKLPGSKIAEDQLSQIKVLENEANAIYFIGKYKYNEYIGTLYNNSQVESNKLEHASDRIKQMHTISKELIDIRDRRDKSSIDRITQIKDLFEKEYKFLIDLIGKKANMLRNQPNPPTTLDHIQCTMKDIPYSLYSIFQSVIRPLDDNTTDTINVQNRLGIHTLEEIKYALPVILGIASDYKSIPERYKLNILQFKGSTSQLPITYEYNTLPAELMLDLKRLGDWDQVLAAKRLSTMDTYKDKIIFVSLDRICAAHAANLGLKTMLVDKASVKILKKNVQQAAVAKSTLSAKRAKAKGGSFKKEDGVQTGGVYDCCDNEISYEDIFNIVSMKASEYLNAYIHTKLGGTLDDGTYKQLEKDLSHIAFFRTLYDYIEDQYRKYNIRIEDTYDVDDYSNFFLEMKYAVAYEETASNNIICTSIIYYLAKYYANRFAINTHVYSSHVHLKYDNYPIYQILGTIMTKIDASEDDEMKDEMENTLDKLLEEESNKMEHNLVPTSSTPHFNPEEESNKMEHNLVPTSSTPHFNPEEESNKMQYNLVPTSSTPFSPVGLLSSNPVTPYIQRHPSASTSSRARAVPQHLFQTVTTGVKQPPTTPVTQRSTSLLGKRPMKGGSHINKKIDTQKRKHSTRKHPTRKQSKRKHSTRKHRN